MKTRQIVVLLLSTCLSSLSLADEVILKNGSKIIGTLVSAGIYLVSRSGDQEEAVDAAATKSTVIQVELPPKPPPFLDGKLPPPPFGDAASSTESNDKD